VGTHWLGRPLLRTLDLHVASLLRASRGARPGFGSPTQKKMGVSKCSGSSQMALFERGLRENGRTWTSSGSGVGRDWIRYSICLAFTMRSSTSSFLFAVAPVCIREERMGGGKIELTFKDIGRVDLVRVTLLCDGDFLRDLDKVDARGEIRDAA